MSSTPSHVPFAILSWGGIGDTLRNLSLIPHASIFEKTGWRTTVIHQPWQEVGCREDALPPGPAAIRDLVERCPSLRWGGVGHLGPVAKFNNRFLRDALAAFHRGTPPLHPFEIRLTSQEAARLPPLDPASQKIAVQTHLLGMSSKKWSINNWQIFLRLLRQKLPTADIHLIEPATDVTELCLDAHFYAHPELNLAQSIALVRQMDFVISVDSWVKTVAAMDRLPQIIIIPDQQTDYPQLTPASLLRHEFATLKFRPEVTLIGLDPQTQSLTLRTMSEIPPEELFAQIAPVLPQ